MSKLSAKALATSSQTAQKEIKAAGRRIWEVDAWRGVAIIMMVIYHFMWDLYMFTGLQVNLGSGFWFYFQRATATSFLFLVGVSLMLSYSRAVSRRGNTDGLYWKFFKRGLQILGIGMGFTIVVRMLPLFIEGYTGRIDFGVLHFIGTSIIIAYPFMRLRWPWLNLLLAPMFYITGRIIETIRLDTYAWVWLGFQPNEYYFYIDYFPLIKWFSVVLLGIFVGQMLYANGKRRFDLPDLSAFFPINLLRFLGRHSLLIYIIHQPILYGLIFLALSV